MGDIIKLSIVLFLVASAAGLAIALTNQKTADKIALQKQLAEEQALSKVFPDEVTISKKKQTDEMPEDYWIAEKNGHLVGYSFKGTNAGYSSNIQFIVGIDPQGTILGLTILSQVETPGLGDRMQEVVSKDYIWNGLVKKFKEKKSESSWFTRQFKGITVTEDIGIDKSAEWHKLTQEKQEKLLKENSVTAITGATISTYAVSSGLKKCVYSYFTKLQALENGKKAVNEETQKSSETQIEDNQE